MFVETQQLPYPDDMVVAGVPIQLIPGDSGDLLGEKAQTLDNVVPTEYNLNAYPLYAERTLPFRRMELGMGTTRQRDGAPRTYSHGLFVDASIGGMVGKGPLFHAQDGAPGQEARDRAQGLDGGVLKAFVGFGRYVYKRNGDLTGDWALSKDFGVGRTVMQMVRFKNRGGTIVDGVYVVLDNGAMWQYDGTTWNPCTLPAGFAPTAIETIDDDLFALGGQELRSATADPTQSANWIAPVYVGEAGAPANWLRALHGQLFAFKEDGLYTISGVGGTLVVKDLLPELRNRRAVTNGRNAYVWRDAVWFKWGDALYKMTTEGDGGFAEIATAGLGVLMENNSEVRGKTVGFAGHGNWFGYFVVTNDGDSYLCKWGTWLNPKEDDPTHYRFSEVPHGALFKWAGKVASLLWVSQIAGPTANERLYVAFTDGSVQYCLLPHGTPSPYTVGCGCEFTTEPGLFYAPQVDCDWPSESKSWRAVTLFAPLIDEANTVRLFFRSDARAAWAELDSSFTTDAQRVDFPSMFGSKNLQQYIRLDNTTTATSPLVEGWGLHHSVVPAVILEYTGAADARLYRVRRNASVDERDPAIIRDTILTAVGSIGAVTCTLPDGSEKELNFFKYSEALDKKWTRIGLEWIVPFKAIEFRTHTVYGTWRRVEAYTWAQVEAFGSWGAVERL